RRRLDDVGRLEMGSGGNGGGELGRELSEGEMLAAPLEEPEDSRVPEGGGAAVAEEHLVALGQREQLNQPRADVADDGPDARAAGVKVVSFGAGEPDFATPDYIVEAAIEAARRPAAHHYTAVGGLPELKEAIAAKTARDSGYQVAPGQVLVTNGGKQAIVNAF